MIFKAIKLIGTYYIMRVVGFALVFIIFAMVANIQPGGQVSTMPEIFTLAEDPHPGGQFPPWWKISTWKKKREPH